MELSDTIKKRTGILQGKRILVTQAGEFMGPMLCEVLAVHGAEVIASKALLSEPGAAESLVASSGVIDVLVANLAIPAPSTPAAEVTNRHLRLKHLYVIILLFYVLQYRTTYVFLINSEIYLDETNYICYALSALSKMLHTLWDVP